MQLAGKVGNVAEQAPGRQSRREEVGDGPGRVPRSGLRNRRPSAWFATQTKEQRVRLPKVLPSLIHLSNLFANFQLIQKLTLIKGL